MTTTPSESRRFSIRLPRPLSIGVATIVLIAAALGLRFGVPIYQQNTAVRQIERLGGLVSMTPGDPNWPTMKASEYMRDKSEILFDDVQCVFFDHSPVDDAGLVCLKRLHRLGWLGLGNAHVTDAGLAHIKELKNLRALGLRSTAVTDAGLVQMKGLSKLRDLDLSQTQVTDAGLEHLRGMTTLEHLLLYETKVTDEGAAELERALPRLHVER